MNLDLYSKIYLVCNIIGTFTIYKFFHLFFSSEGLNKKIETLSYIMYYIIIDFIYIIYNNAYLNMFCNLLLFFILTFNYNASKKQKIIAVLLLYVVLLCTETSIVLICNIFTNKSLILPLVITKIVSYTIVISLSNFKNIQKKLPPSRTLWISLLFFPLGTLILFNNILNINIESIILKSLLVLLLFNIFIFYIYDNLNKEYYHIMEKELEIQEKDLVARHYFLENQIYENQLKIIEKSQQELRQMKHDYKGYYITLKSMIIHNKDEAISFLDSINSEYSYNKLYIDSGNIAVDSILNYKIQEATKVEIDIKTKIKIYPDIKIEPFDLNTILCNILDNAIEATSKIENKFIDFSLEYDRGVVYISIKNTYNPESIKLDNKNSLISSKAKSEYHGIGLTNVKKSVEKYHGEIVIDYDQKFFYLDIVLYESE